jgi:hypothetical protein
MQFSCGLPGITPTSGDAHSDNVIRPARRKVVP